LAEESIRELLAMFRDRLTDLTGRNKSLKLMKLYNKSHFDLWALDSWKEGHGLDVLTRFLAKPNAVVPFLTVGDLSETGGQLNHRLTQLKREIDLIEQETGSNTFYIAFGFLEGYFHEDLFLRCPLLFYPARLKRAKVGGMLQWVVEREEENGPFFNRTFLLAAQKFAGLQLAEELEGVAETLPDKPDEILGHVRKALIRYQIELSPPDKADAAEVFQLSAFRAMKAADAPAYRKGFILRPYAVAGKYQQSTSTLLNDYEHLLNNFPEQGLLADLLNRRDTENELETIESDILNTVHEKDYYFVTKTDASQEAVVVASREAKGLIVHGPPGTGKSQVIVNLVADRLARGERVLVVCQKPTALNVVYNRLGSIHLKNHVALVHDYAKSKGYVYSKLAEVLDRTSRHEERSLEPVSNELQALAERLNAIAHSLHAKRPYGKTLYWLYSHANWGNDPRLDVSKFAERMTYEELNNQLQVLRGMVRLMSTYDHPNHPWSKRKSFASYTVEQQFELKDTLSRIVKQLTRGLEVKAEYEFPYSPLTYLRHRDVLEGLERALLILQNASMSRHVLMFYQNEHREFEQEDEIGKVKGLFGSIQRHIQWLDNRSEPVTALTPAEADVWDKKIREFLGLNEKTLARWLSPRWRTLRKELQVLCRQQGLPFDGAAVRQYLEKIETFLKYEALRSEALGHHLFSDVPVLNELSEWESWLGKKKRALEFLELYVQAQAAFPKWLSSPKSQQDLEAWASSPFERHVNHTIEMAKITQELRGLIDQLRPYQASDEVAAMQKEVEEGIYDLARFEGMLHALADFESMVQLDVRKSALEDMQANLLQQCGEKAPLEQTPDAADQWGRMIANSFYNQWILTAEAAEPHVKEVSTELYGGHVARYRELLREKRVKLPGWIDHRVLQRSLEVRNPGRKIMKNEAAKKRSQAPLRRMMASYVDDLLQLIPCWLCTPEAVSAIFPSVEGLFDLVIFDEASQLPVENAVPSLLRAKRVVVAGDEKQLPPSDFFRKSVEEEDLEDGEDSGEYKDGSDKTAQSLLEWGKSRFVDQWLAWHYRSKHQALINFSNYAFYGKRMQIAPNASFDSEKPIDFLHVQGTWIGQSNLVEAERVADLIVDLLRTRPEQTLGVITFNTKQTELIKDLLDRRSAENHEVQLLIEKAWERKHGEEDVGLFVKNIENVQGDERDIIVFSVAYAKNEEGKMVSSFGPLQREAGPNRLNVAITRAKEKVYLVCSFDPSEWHRAETYQSGVRLLKKYLEYGKAISDGNDPMAAVILNGLLDAMNVRDQKEPGEYESIFEEQVGEALRSLGYHIRKQVGFSGYRIDMAVIHPEHPGRFVLGIECDGATYHSSKVARERDLYRQRFLESQGWNIHRIWSRNWWVSPDNELKKLEQVIQKLITGLRDGMLV